MSAAEMNSAVKTWHVVGDRKSKLEFNEVSRLYDIFVAKILKLRNESFRKHYYRSQADYFVIRYKCTPCNTFFQFESNRALCEENKEVEWILRFTPICKCFELTVTEEDEQAFEVLDVDEMFVLKEGEEIIEIEEFVVDVTSEEAYTPRTKQQMASANSFNPGTPTSSKMLLPPVSCAVDLTSDEIYTPKTKAQMAVVNSFTAKTPTSSKRKGSALTPLANAFKSLSKDNSPQLTKSFTPRGPLRDVSNKSGLDIAYDKFKAVVGRTETSSEMAVQGLEMGSQLIDSYNSLSTVKSHLNGLELRNRIKVPLSQIMAIWVYNENTTEGRKTKSEIMKELLEYDSSSFARLSGRRDLSKEFSDASNLGSSIDLINSTRETKKKEKSKKDKKKDKKKSRTEHQSRHKNDHHQKYRTEEPPRKKAKALPSSDSEVDVVTL